MNQKFQQKNNVFATPSTYIYEAHIPETMNLSLNFALIIFHQGLGLMLISISHFVSAIHVSL